MQQNENRIHITDTHTRARNSILQKQKCDTVNCGQKHKTDVRKSAANRIENERKKKKNTHTEWRARRTHMGQNKYK